MKDLAVYCAYEALDEVFLFKEQYPDLYELLYKHGSLVLDGDDQTHEDRLRSCVWLKARYKQRGRHPRNDPRFFARLAAEEYGIVPAGAIVIAPGDEERSGKLGRKHGVLFVSSQALQPTLYHSSKSFTWSWKAGEQRTHTTADGQAHNGWAAVLNPVTEDCAVAPTCAVINDDYLFAGGVDVHRMCDNIFSIVRGLVGSEYAGPLDVLIVAGCSKTYDPKYTVSSARIDQILNRLNSLKAGSACAIHFGILTHAIDPKKYDEFHERFIITDYAIASSEHGFLNFNGATATQANDLKLHFALYNISEPIGDVPYKKMLRKLAAIRDLKKLNTAMASPSTHFKRGHVDNRLIAD